MDRAPADRRPVTVRDFLSFADTPGAHRVALRAGISVLVPQVVVLSLGRPDWSLYAAFGAFTSLYGRGHVHLSRATMQVSAGACLTASVVLGVLVGTSESRAWVAVGVATVVAVLVAALSAAQDWHPPGPLFAIFGFGATASFSHPSADLGAAAAVTAATATFAVLVGNAGAYLRRDRGQPVRLAPAWTWQPVRYAVAVLLAGSAATAVGIGHPYWATVAAVVPLSARSLTAQLVRAGNRMIGTLLGLLPSAALLALHLKPLPTVLVVAGLQIGAELLVGRHYGVALLFITPMALLMGQVAAPRPMGQLLFDRGVETVIGALIGGGLVLLGAQLRRRRTAFAD
ncbi:MAG: FUSC family protein [Actinomycetes bacterium]